MQILRRDCTYGTLPRYRAVPNVPRVLRLKNAGLGCDAAAFPFLFLSFFGTPTDLWHYTYPTRYLYNTMNWK